MANDKHFRIKNGLKVGSTEVISESAKISTDRVFEPTGELLTTTLTGLENDVSSLQSALGEYETSLNTLTLIQASQVSASSSLSSSLLIELSISAARSSSLLSEIAASDSASNAGQRKLTASAASVNAEAAYSAASAAQSAIIVSRASASSSKSAANALKNDVDDLKTDVQGFKNSASADQLSVSAAKSAANVAKQEAQAFAGNAQTEQDSALAHARCAVFAASAARSSLTASQASSSAAGSARVAAEVFETFASEASANSGLASGNAELQRGLAVNAAVTASANASAALASQGIAFVYAEDAASAALSASSASVTAEAKRVIAVEASTNSQLSANTSKLAQESASAAASSALSSDLASGASESAAKSSFAAASFFAEESANAATSASTSAASAEEKRGLAATAASNSNNSRSSANSAKEAALGSASAADSARLASNLSESSARSSFAAAQIFAENSADAATNASSSMATAQSRESLAATAASNSGSSASSANISRSAAESAERASNISRSSAKSSLASAIIFANNAANAQSNASSAAASAETQRTLAVEASTNSQEAATRASNFSDSASAAASSARSANLAAKESESSAQSSFAAAEIFSDDAAEAATNASSSMATAQGREGLAATAAFNANNSRSAANSAKEAARGSASAADSAGLAASISQSSAKSSFGAAENFAENAANSRADASSAAATAEEKRVLAAEAATNSSSSFSAANSAKNASNASESSARSSAAAALVFSEDAADAATNASSSMATAQNRESLAAQASFNASTSKSSASAAASAANSAANLAGISESSARSSAACSIVLAENASNSRADASSAAATAESKRLLAANAATSSASSSSAANIAANLAGLSSSAAKSSAAAANIFSEQAANAATTASSAQASALDSKDLAVEARTASDTAKNIAIDTSLNPFFEFGKQGWKILDSSILLDSSLGTIYTSDSDFDSISAIVGGVTANASIKSGPNKQWIHTNRKVPVETDRVYRFKGRVKAVKENTNSPENFFSKILIGHVPFDIQGRALSGVLAYQGGATTGLATEVCVSAADAAFTTYEGVVTGVGSDSKHFPANTYAVSPVILVQYEGASSGGDSTADYVIIDELSMEDFTADFNSRSSASAANSARASASISETNAAQARTSACDAAASALSFKELAASSETAAAASESAANSARAAANIILLDTVQSASDASSAAASATSSKELSANSQFAAQAAEKATVKLSGNSQFEFGLDNYRNGKIVSGELTTDGIEAGITVVTGGPTANAALKFDQKSRWLTTERAIPVDTSRKYEITARIKVDGEAGEQAEVYIGFQCADINGSNITTGPNPHRWGVANGLMVSKSSDYVVISGIMTGESSSAVDTAENRSKFKAGTKFARPVILPYYTNSTNNFTLVDELSVTDVTERELAKESASAANSSRAAASISEFNATNSEASASSAKAEAITSKNLSVSAATVAVNARKAALISELIVVDNPVIDGIGSETQWRNSTSVLAPDETDPRFLNELGAFNWWNNAGARFGSDSDFGTFYVSYDALFPGFTNPSVGPARVHNYSLDSAFLVKIKFKTQLDHSSNAVNAHLCVMTRDANGKRLRSTGAGSKNSGLETLELRNISDSDGIVELVGLIYGEGYEDGALDNIPLISAQFNNNNVDGKNSFKVSTSSFAGAQSGASAPATTITFGIAFEETDGDIDNFYSLSEPYIYINRFEVINYTDFVRGDKNASDARNAASSALSSRAAADLIKEDVLDAVTDASSAAVTAISNKELSANSETASRTSASSSNSARGAALIFATDAINAKTTASSAAITATVQSGLSVNAATAAQNSSDSARRSASASNSSRGAASIFALDAADAKTDASSAKATAISERGLAVSAATSARKSFSAARLASQSNLNKFFYPFDDEGRGWCSAAVASVADGGGLIFHEGGGGTASMHPTYPAIGRLDIPVWQFQGEYKGGGTGVKAQIYDENGDTFNFSAFGTQGTTNEFPYEDDWTSFNIFIVAGTAVSYSPYRIGFDNITSSGKRLYIRDLNVAEVTDYLRLLDKSESAANSASRAASSKASASAFAVTAAEAKTTASGAAVTAEQKRGLAAQAATEAAASASATQSAFGAAIISTEEAVAINTSVCQASAAATSAKDIAVSAKTVTLKSQSATNLATSEDLNKYFYSFDDATGTGWKNVAEVFYTGALKLQDGTHMQPPYQNLTTDRKYLVKGKYNSVVSTPANRPRISFRDENGANPYGPSQITVHSGSLYFDNSGQLTGGKSFCAIISSKQARNNWTIGFDLVNSGDRLDIYELSWTDVTESENARLSASAGASSLVAVTIAEANAVLSASAAAISETNANNAVSTAEEERDLAVTAAFSASSSLSAARSARAAADIHASDAAQAFADANLASGSASSNKDLAVLAAVSSGNSANSSITAKQSAESFANELTGVLRSAVRDVDTISAEVFSGLNGHYLLNNQYVGPLYNNTKDHTVLGGNIAPTLQYVHQPLVAGLNEWGVGSFGLGTSSQYSTSYWTATNASFSRYNNRFRVQNTGSASPSFVEREFTTVADNTYQISYAQQNRFLSQCNVRLYDGDTGTLLTTNLPSNSRDVSKDGTVKGTFVAKSSSIKVKIECNGGADVEYKNFFLAKVLKAPVTLDFSSSPRPDLKTYDNFLSDQLPKNYQNHPSVTGSLWKLQSPTGVTSIFGNGDITSIPENYSSDLLAFASLSNPNSSNTVSTTNQSVKAVIYSPFEDVEVSVYTHVYDTSKTYANHHVTREGTTPAVNTFTVKKGETHVWDLDSDPDYSHGVFHNKDHRQQFTSIFKGTGKILGYVRYSGSLYSPLVPMSNQPTLIGVTDNNTHGVVGAFPQFVRGDGIDLSYLETYLQNHVNGNLSASLSTLGSIFDEVDSSGKKYGDLTGTGSISSTDVDIIQDYRNGTNLGENYYSYVGRLYSLIDRIDHAKALGELQFTSNLYPGNDPLSNSARGVTNTADKLFAPSSKRTYFAVTYDNRSSGRLTGMPLSGLSDFYMMNGASKGQLVSIEPGTVTISYTDTAGNYISSNTHIDSFTSATVSSPKMTTPGLSSGKTVHITSSVPIYAAFKADKWFTGLGLRQALLAADSSQTAFAERVQETSSTVDSFTATVTETAQSIDGIEANYAVKINNNGFVSGFGLTSTGPTTSPVSAFTIQADRFAVVDPSSYNENLTITPATANIPFEINSAGNTLIKNAFIAQLTSDNIKTQSLKADTLTSSGTIEVYDSNDKINTYAALDGSNPIYRIYAGDTDPSLAPFSVTSSGDVSANNLNFSGPAGNYFSSNQGFGVGALAEISSFVKSDRRYLTESLTIPRSLADTNTGSIAITLTETTDLYQQVRIDARRMGIVASVVTYTDPDLPMKMVFPVGNTNATINNIFFPEAVSDENGDTIQYVAYLSSDSGKRKTRSEGTLNFYKGDHILVVHPFNAGDKLEASGGDSAFSWKMQTADGSFVNVTGAGVTVPSTAVETGEVLLVAEGGLANVIITDADGVAKQFYAGSDNIYEKPDVKALALADVPRKVKIIPQRWQSLDGSRCAIMASQTGYDADGAREYTGVVYQKGSVESAGSDEYLIRTSPVVRTWNTETCTAAIDVRGGLSGAVDSNGYLAAWTTIFQTSEGADALPGTSAGPLSAGTWYFGANVSYFDENGNAWTTDSDNFPTQGSRYTYLNGGTHVVELEGLTAYQDDQVLPTTKVDIKNPDHEEVLTSMRNATLADGDAAYGLTFSGDSYWVLENDFIPWSGVTEPASVDKERQAIILGNVSSDPDNAEKDHLFVVATRLGPAANYKKRLNLTSDGTLYVGPNGESKVVTKSSAKVAFSSSQIHIQRGIFTSSTISAPLGQDYTQIKLQNNDDLKIYDNLSLRYTFNSNGNFTASGNVSAFSDQRLKSDVKTLDGTKVLDMRGVEFVKGGEKSSGVIAQELEKVAPELVDSSGEYKAVSYGNIAGYLIEAIKRQEKQIKELQEKLEEIVRGSSK